MLAVPRVSHILETSLYVADLERARDFYERVFGFEVFMNDQRMCSLGVPGGGVLLLFRRGTTADPSPTSGGTIPAHHGEGAVHLCFAVPRGELQSWERHLAAVGISPESRVVWGRGGESLYFRDLDGHSLEVATPGLWPNY